MITVPVNLGERSYEVLVGPGAKQALAKVIPSWAQRAAVVTQELIPVDVDPGVESRRFLIANGESAKSLRTLEALWRAFAQWGLTRADVVLALGGGVVTDVAGFAASTYLRGVPVVNVATTLLGQVDAAIGGKTAVNLPEGKNLVGSFAQPTAVICDTDALDSLPPREWRCGLGEVAKYSLMGEAGLDDLPLAEKIARCAEIKAAVVEADEREAGARALLNYGHTLAHALEGLALRPDVKWDLAHGEAVGVGLVFAARLARRLGRVGEAEVSRHLAVVKGYDLPVEIPPGAESADLIQFMGADKKSVRGLTFVLHGPPGLEVVPGVDPDDVESTLKEMGAE